MLINDEWAEHLVLGSSWISVSVNAATKSVHEVVNLKSNFDRVILGIKRLVNQKRRHGRDVRIVYKFTIVPENLHQLADAIEVADALGCDDIAYGYANGVKEALEQNNDLRRGLMKRLQALSGRDLGVTIERNRLEHLGLMANEIWRFAPSYFALLGLPGSANKVFTTHDSRWVGKYKP